MCKRQICLLIIVFFCSQIFGGELQITPKRYFDLIHTELDLKPLWKTHQMDGEAILTLTPYFSKQFAISLDANQLETHEVQLIENETKKNLDFKQTDTKLHIRLGKTYSKADTFKLCIRYTANPDKVVDDKGKPKKDEKGLYFINTDGKRKDVPMHLWTQGETHSNSSWFPTLDHTLEKHTQSIKVTYEGKYVSLANGKLVSSIQNDDGTKTDFWVQNIPHSVYLTVLVVGDYKIVKDEWRGKEVSYYMEPQYENMARPIFGNTVEMMEFYSNLLGVDYPWDKYSQVIVHDFTAGAMENTTAVTYNTMFQKDARELFDGNDDETVAHELFHHWFGDIVTCESWTHLTLNESFANYGEYLWFEHKYGKNRAEYHWEQDMEPYFGYSFRKKEPLVRYSYKNPDDMFDMISYNKGGKILHMLREYVGDKAFFESLKLYLTKYAYQTAEFSNLRQCFEEITGEDLYWFFKQWYEKGGHPILQSYYTRTLDSTILIVSQRHNFDSAFLYRIPLDIDVYTGDIKKSRRYWLINRVDTFVIYESDIKVISIDGANSLVGIKNESREVDDWLYILKNSNSYLDQTKAIKKLTVHRDRQKVKDAYFEALTYTNDRVVREVIKNIDKKWLNHKPQWNEKLVEIINSKRKSTAKSKAIEKLGEAKKALDFESNIVTQLKDSSYQVENAALSFLAKHDPKKAYQLAKDRLNVSNFSLLNNAFEIVALEENPKDESLFTNAYPKAKGYNKIAVYLNYGIYIAAKDFKDIDSHIRDFENLLESDDEMDAYCAKSALKMLKSELVKRDRPKAKKRIEQIESILKKDKEMR